ncbi:MAG: hypothetical protein GC201_09300 [Alphaproteobacteria bacterium]|nr:hypothetical protein [Alphaproteobacteria bacterium]
MIRTFLAALLLSALAIPALADDARPQCKGSPKVVDECVTLYGVLGVYTGTPSIRIWPVGTKKLYGVSDTRDDGSVWLPPRLKDALAANPVEINGKFVMCPLEPARDNHLTLVCLESATELRPVSREQPAAAAPTAPAK